MCSKSSLVPDEVQGLSRRNSSIPHGEPVHWQMIRKARKEDSVPRVGKNIRAVLFLVIMSMFQVMEMQNKELVNKIQFWVCW